MNTPAPDAGPGLVQRLLRSARWRTAIDRLGWIDAPGGARARAPAPPLHDAPLDVLTAKLVFDHARNRQQLLGPPPTALGQLDNDRTELLVRFAILAAAASSALDEAAQGKLRGILSSVGLQSSDPAFFNQAVEQPTTLDQLLQRVRDAHLVSLAYAASLLAADGHDAAGKAWLRYLAVRMRIPDETLTRLHSQFGIAL